MKQWQKTMLAAAIASDIAGVGVLMPARLAGCVLLAVGSLLAMVATVVGDA